MEQTGSRKLVGNPRSGPMEKNNDLWKNFFLYYVSFL